MAFISYLVSQNITYSGMKQSAHFYFPLHA